MSTAFVDSWFWIAVLAENDQWHTGARQWAGHHPDAETVTTEYVLVEVLNHFASRGEMLRTAATNVVWKLLSDPAVTVLGSSREGFLNAFELYRQRPDKGYSLTDCHSMVVMRELGLTEVLTGDRHFEQEGFTLAL